MRHTAASAHFTTFTLPAQEVAAVHEQLRALQAAHAAVEQQAAQQAEQLEQQTALATADSQAQQEWLGVVKQVRSWAARLLYECYAHLVARHMGKHVQEHAAPPPASAPLCRQH